MESHRMSYPPPAHSEHKRTKTAAWFSLPSFRVFLSDIQRKVLWYVFGGLPSLFSLQKTLGFIAREI